MKRINILSNFWIKIIAIVTMTLDHIGFFMIQYGNKGETLYDVGTVLRYFGRLALPLFCFLIVEGALHTKSIKKYILRLVLIMTPIMIFQIIVQFGFNYAFYQGNIFIDLIFGVLMVWALEKKNVFIKFLAVIPPLIGLVSLFCFSYEAANIGTMIWWFPYFSRPQYDIFSSLLVLAFYASYKIVPFLFKRNGLNPELHKENNYYRLALNAVSCVGLVALSSLYFALGSYVMPNLEPVFKTYWNSSVQFFAVFASIPIILYNGRRGYNAKWFNIFSYIYYPVHLITIYIVFWIIMVLIK